MRVGEVEDGGLPVVPRAEVLIAMWTEHVLTAAQEASLPGVHDISLVTTVTTDHSLVA